MSPIRTRPDLRSLRVSTSIADKTFERLHRDYYVMFNDSFRLTHEEGSSEDVARASDIDISSLVTNVNVSYNVDSPPASCDLTLRVPRTSYADHRLRDIADSFREMDEVRVFFKNRFPYENSEEGTYEYGYSQVFWGIVVRKSVTREENFIDINMSCQDMLWWWSRSRFNSNAALIDRSNNEYNSESGVRKFNYGAMTPFQVIHFISKSIPEDFASNIAAGVQRSVGDADSLKRKAPYNRWQLRLTQISNNLKIVGVNGVQSSDEQRNFVRSSATDQESIQLGFVNPQSAGRNTDLGTGENVLKTKLIMDEDFLENVKPFAEIVKPSTFDSDFRTRLDIASEVAKIIGFEFFQDTNGEILFKPPYYNMHVSYTENPVYVLNNLDIRSSDYSVDASEVITEITVSGKISESLSKTNDVSQLTFALYRDTHLASIYGIQDEQISLDWVLTNTQALIFAIGELDRINARVHKSSITIEGRPELRLGRPIYVSGEDSFYYIRGISHSYTNGSFTTSLDLDTRRSRFFNPETKQYQENMVAVISPILEDGKKVIRPISGSIVTGGVVAYKSNTTNLKHISIENDEIRKPVSDQYGYSLTGSFAYGKNLMIDADGNIKKRSSDSRNNQKVDRILKFPQVFPLTIKRQSGHPDLKDNFDSGFQDLIGAMQSVIGVPEGSDLGGGIIGKSFGKSIKGLAQNLKSKVKSIGKGIGADILGSLVNGGGLNIGKSLKSSLKISIKGVVKEELKDAVLGELGKQVSKQLSKSSKIAKVGNFLKVKNLNSAIDKVSGQLVSAAAPKLQAALNKIKV